MAPKVGRNEQRFDLVVPGGEMVDEVERLVSLGATRLEGIGDVMELADPDGNEFTVAAR